MADNNLSKRLRYFVSKIMPSVVNGLDEKGNIAGKSTYKKMFNFVDELWHLNNMEEPFINNFNKYYQQYGYDKKLRDGNIETDKKYGLKLEHLDYIVNALKIDHNTILSDDVIDYNVIYEWDDDRQFKEYLASIKKEIKSVKVATVLITGTEMYVVLNKQKKSIKRSFKKRISYSILVAESRRTSVGYSLNSS